MVVGADDRSVDEVLLAFMFAEHLGGFTDVHFQNNVITFPQTSIPDYWLQLAESGPLRWQIDGKFYRLWKPYHFLLKWIRGTCQLFHFTDVEQLRYEIERGTSAPDTKKEYYFQRAGINLLQGNFEVLNCC